MCARPPGRPHPPRRKPTEAGSRQSRFSSCSPCRINAHARSLSRSPLRQALKWASRTAPGDNTVWFLINVARCNADRSSEVERAGGVGLKRGGSQIAQLLHRKHAALLVTPLSVVATSGVRNDADYKATERKHTRAPLQTAIRRFPNTVRGRESMNAPMARQTRFNGIRRGWPQRQARHASTGEITRDEREGG